MAILVVILLILVSAGIYKPVYGYMFYIAIRLCLPTSIRIMNFSYNTIAFLLLMACVLPECIRRFKLLTSWKYKFVVNFFYFAASLLGLSILSTFVSIVPWQYQLSKLAQMVYTELLPAIMLVIILQRRDIRLFNNLLAVCALYSLLYAIFTFVTQTNPIYEMFYTAEEQMIDAASNSRNGMLDGVAVGIYNNKISMSLMSLLYFIYFFNKNNASNILISTVVILAFIVTFLTSQRSAILSELLFGTYMIFRSKMEMRSVYIWGGLFFVVSIVLLMYLNQFDKIGGVFKSTFLIFDDKAQQDLGVSGSTVELRIKQYLTVFDMIKSNLFWGMGYGFTSYFYEVIWNAKAYGLRDDVAGFESIFLPILLNTGFLGLLMWSRMFLGILRILRSQCTTKFQRCYTDAFMLTYLLVVTLTDTSGSMFLFFLFCAMNKYSVRKTNNKIIETLLKVKLLIFAMNYSSKTESSSYK